jgi:hypothetical protein
MVQKIKREEREKERGKKRVKGKERKVMPHDCTRAKDNDSTLPTAAGRQSNQATSATSE